MYYIHNLNRCSNLCLSHHHDYTPSQKHEHKTLCSNQLIVFMDACHFDVPNSYNFSRIF